MPIRLNAFPAQFTPIPFENMAYIANEKEKRNDKADTELSAFAKLSKVNAITQDQELRTNEVHKYTNQVEALVKSTPSDKLGSILPQIKQIKREFENNLNYGPLNVIQGRYNSQLASFTEKDEASKKFGESGGQHGMSYEDSALAKNVEANQQENLKQDEFGRWTTESKKLYSPISTIHTPAIHKLGIEYADKIKNQEVTHLNHNLTETNKPGIYYNIETHREVSEADAREELVRNALLTNPIVAQYDNWKNSITGNDKKVTEAYKTLISNPNNLIQPDLENPGFYKSYSPTHPALLKEFDALLHPQVYESAKSIGALGAVNNNNDQIKFITAPNDKVAETTNNTTPLNIPSTQGNNSVSTTVENLNTTVFNKITATPVFAGSYGPGMGMFNTTVARPDHPTVYNTLSHLDKTRVDFIRNDPNLNVPQDITTWGEPEWKKVVGALKVFETKKIFSVLNAYTDPKFRKETGSTYNANMEQFLYYDVNNSIAKKDNKMYTGVELRSLGYKIEELVGTMSNSNIIPTKVAGTAYTFARPDVVTTVKLDNSGGGQFYVGINAAQIDNNYRMSALENALQISSSIGIPYPLFNNSDLVVVPKGKLHYEIVLPDKNSVTIQGNTSKEFRHSVINAYNSSPYLQELIENSIFNAQE